MSGTVMPGAYAAWESGPKDPVTALWHCRCCVTEFEGPESCAECPTCGREAIEGEFEPGACALCGALREEPLEGWVIEGQEDMNCAECAEDN